MTDPTPPLSLLSDHALGIIAMKAKAATTPAELAAAPSRRQARALRGRRAIADAAVQAERERVAALADDEPLVTYVMTGRPEMTEAEFFEYAKTIDGPIVYRKKYTYAPNAGIGLSAVLIGNREAMTR
jgi:hypothetical protein